MKTKILTFFILMVLSIGYTTAQQDKSAEDSIVPPHGKRVILGLTVGSGFDWIMPRNEKFNPNGGYANLSYGIPVDINFTTGQFYYFSTGVMFHHLGGKLKFNLYDDNSPTDSVVTNRLYRSIYLTIPTGVKLKTPQFKNFVFGVNFGLYHSFLLSAKSIDKYSIGNTDHKTTNSPYVKQMAIFREAGYLGIGGEYIIKGEFRTFVYINYAYTFTNFFSRNNQLKEKGNVNSIEVIAGFSF